MADTRGRWAWDVPGFEPPQPVVGAAAGCRWRRRPPCQGAAYRHGGPRRRGRRGGGSRRRPPRPARGQRPGVCSLCSRSVDVMGMVMVAVVLGFWADLVGGLGGMG